MEYLVELACSITTGIIDPNIEIIGTFSKKLLESWQL